MPRRTRLWLSAFLAASLGQAAQARTLEREAKATLTALEMDKGDVLLFRLKNGQVRRLELDSTRAEALFTNRDGRLENSPEAGSKLVYGFSATFKADGHPLVLRRLVGTQESFYEPYVINGMRVWLDAVQDIFSLVKEAHGVCRPTRLARLAVQDATLPIAPEKILPWYPSPDTYIRIADCYFGDDCWLGAFGGTDAHGGLDIAMPAGTLLRSPFKLDKQGLILETAKGDKNNRWEGVRRWSDGSLWAIQVSHLARPQARPGAPLKAGGLIGATALTAVGYVEHSHFNFFVREPGGDIALDPWILFWQAFKAGADPFVAPGPLKTGETLRLSAAPEAGACLWTFGDGAFSRERSPEHRYSKAGIYPVTLALEGKNPFTAHVSVDGPASEQPSLVLEAEDFSFRREPAGVFRAYREARGAVQTVKLLAMSGSSVESLEEQRTLAKGEKPYYNFEPAGALLRAVNAGGGGLPPLAKPELEYPGRGGWLDVSAGAEANTWNLRARPQGLEAGRYDAWLKFKAPGTLNGDQETKVELEVTALSPAWNAVVDDGDAGFEKSPGFWVAPVLPAWWARPGYAGRAYVNGRRPEPGQAARFTPYLWGGVYKVSLGSRTPFDKDSRFQVRIRHAGGTETRWVEPGKSLDLGDWRFAFGNRGWVEILTDGSRGQVSADAVFFMRQAD